MNTLCKLQTWSLAIRRQTHNTRFTTLFVLSIAHFFHMSNISTVRLASIRSQLALDIALRTDA
jgi:hypothetical protein